MRRERAVKIVGCRTLVLILFSLVSVVACTGDDAETPGGTSAAAAPSPRPTEAARSVATRPAAAKQVAAFDPSSFTLQMQDIAGGFSNPLYVTGAGDGSGRLFVVEQGGTIRIWQNGAVLPDPFLDIRALVRAGGEQGLLGLVFHPRYAENGRFFVNYTATNGDNTVAEFHVSADPNRADPAPRRMLWAIPDFAPNHNAGMLAFGPDGYLYAGTGDGGGGGDPQRTAQNLQAWLGKMLRVDVDGGDPYAIPPGNPFAGRADVRPEVWAYGLRNPWRFSFDRTTGDLWLADVGQGDWEEINLQPAASTGGENYGWSIMEGTHCFRPKDGCSRDGLTPPIHEYDHGGGNCSVTGGYVYRGRAYAEMVGGYFFADYCSGRIWALSCAAGGAWEATELAHLPVQISSFGEDDAGELYITALNTGAVLRLSASPR